MREIGRANLIGTTARELIARRDCIGRVLAVVTGAVYLQAEPRFSPSEENGIPENEIFWLAQNHVSMHPCAIRGDFDFTPLRDEMAVICDGRWLRFDTRRRTESRLHFADTPVWIPPTISPGRILPRDIVSNRARELHNVIRLEMPHPVNALPISQVERACRDGNLPHALQVGRELVGLGPGLTPSGDDFLGALLFVAWHLHVAYPETFEWEQQAVGDWLDWAHPRTNSISYAILRNHANGKGAEPLHNLVTALFQGKALDEMTAHVRVLLAIGSTSGWNMLVGAMTGLLLIERTH